MNYNAFYPYGYTMPQMQPQMQPQQNPQNSIQTSLLSIPNEQEARSFPIVPGNCLIFRDETEPCVYIKTLGFSPQELPTFDIYVKKTPSNASSATDSGANEKDIDLSVYAAKDDLRALEAELVEIRRELSALKPRKKVIREVEVESDDE